MWKKKRSRTKQNSSTYISWNMAYQTISPLFMESLYLSPFHDVGRREIMGLLLYGTKVHIGVHYILQTVVVIVHRESFWVIWILSPLWCWQPPNSCFTKFDSVKTWIEVPSIFLTVTMRTDLLNWCNLVSISKNVLFYAFGVVRIYYYLADFVNIY